MNGKSKPCQDLYPDLLEYTAPDQRKYLGFRRYFWRLKKICWQIEATGLREFIRRKRRRPRENNAHLGALNLRPGDIVEVRTEKEIFSTLDENDKHKGLQFTREMRKYCGKRFKVLRRVNKILVETTGELRSIKEPTVILDGVICDGSFHGNCDRMCFCFWREIWLKKINEQ